MHNMSVLFNPLIDAQLTVSHVSSLFRFLHVERNKGSECEMWSCMHCFTSHIGRMCLRTVGTAIVSAFGVCTLFYRRVCHNSFDYSEGTVTYVGGVKFLELLPHPACNLSSL